MPVVVFPAQATPAANSPGDRSGGQDVATAVDRYLASIQTKTTRASYAETLAGRTALTGARDADAVEPEDFAAVMGRWDSAAAATWNRHLSALTSFTTWAQRQEILTTNPARRLERREPARRGDRSIPQARLDKLFTDDRHGLREAGAVADAVRDRRPRRRDHLPRHQRPRPEVPTRPRPLQRRRHRTRPLGHRNRPPPAPAAPRPHLRPGVPRRTARPHLGSRAPAAADICPQTGRARLSYPRAEYLFKQATATLDPHKKGWTLHQLRHFALQHLAALPRPADARDSA